MVEVQLRIIHGGEVEEFASLWDWLRDEPALRGLVQHVEKSIEPTEMSGGGLIEVLTVALGSGGAGAALAGSLGTWLQTRRPTVTLTVSVGGRTVEMHAHQVGARQADETLAILRDVLTGDADDQAAAAP